MAMKRPKSITRIPWSGPAGSVSGSRPEPLSGSCGGAPDSSGSDTILVGQVLERLAGGDDRAGYMQAGVDPVDAQLGAARIGEAMRHTRGHPGRVTGGELELRVAHLRSGRTH